jgi:hypothetical protein
LANLSLSSGRNPSAVVENSQGYWGAVRLKSQKNKRKWIGTAFAIHHGGGRK